MPISGAGGQSAWAAARAWKWLPGLTAAVVVAGAATIVAGFLPPVVGAVLVAVTLGVMVGNAVPPSLTASEGLSFAAGPVLRVGVALLGVRLTISDVVSTGGPAVVAIVATMTATFLIVACASRLAGISPRLAVLIGLGTAVCGNSAIAAAAPIIDAEDREVSVAVATITAFGMSALLLFPLIAGATGLGDRTFGIWAGLAINDTSQVVAAGAAHSTEALEVATVVKLVRNALMAPLILMLAWWAARHRACPDDAPASHATALEAFPLFLLAFLALVGLRSLGLLGDVLLDAASTMSTWLITIAIAAIGLRTRLRDLRSIGVRPFAVGFGASTSLAILGFGLANWLAA